MALAGAYAAAVAGRADDTVDAAIDASVDRMHEVVLARLGVPVQEDLAVETAIEFGQFSELIR